MSVYNNDLYFNKLGKDIILSKNNENTGSPSVVNLEKIQITGWEIGEATVDRCHSCAMRGTDRYTHGTAFDRQNGAALKHQSAGWLPFEGFLFFHSSFLSAFLTRILPCVAITASTSNA